MLNTLDVNRQMIYEMIKGCVWQLTDLNSEEKEYLEKTDYSKLIDSVVSYFLDDSRIEEAAIHAWVEAVADHTTHCDNCNTLIVANDEFNTCDHVYCESCYNECATRCKCCLEDKEDEEFNDNGFKFDICDSCFECIERRVNEHHIGNGSDIDYKFLSEKNPGACENFLYYISQIICSTEGEFREVIDEAYDKYLKPIVDERIAQQNEAMAKEEEELLNAISEEESDKLLAYSLLKRSIKYAQKNDHRKAYEFFNAFNTVADDYDNDEELRTYYFNMYQELIYNDGHCEEFKALYRNFHSFWQSQKLAENNFGIWL